MLLSRKLILTKTDTDKPVRPFQYIAILFVAILGLATWLHFTGFIGFLWLPLLCIVYFVLLYLGVTQIRWNFYIPSLNKGNNKHFIALTFDDGPNAETAAILDVLKQEQVKAAFFCIGKHIERDQATVLRMYDEGHAVGNHSYYHTSGFDWMSSKRMLAEIEKCNSLIRKVTGRQPHLFRPPYGITNPNLYRAVKRSGMASIGWSLRSFDTVVKNPEQLKNRIINKLSGGDIILLHDSMPVTREILTDLIRQARKKGFTFVRIDQLLDVPAYA